MADNHRQVSRTPATEDAIEPELVSAPPPEGAPGRAHYNIPGKSAGFGFKLKMFLSAAVFFTALALIITGAALTATIIGAILGIPLMLAGILLIWLLLKLLVFTGGGGFFVSGGAHGHGFPGRRRHGPRRPPSDGAY